MSENDFQQITIEVLKQLEPLFGASDRVAEGTFYVADRDNRRVSYVSSSYKNVWGRAADSLQRDPLNWMESIHPDDLDRVQAAFSQRREIGSMDIEYRVVRPDQRVRYIRDTSLIVKPQGVGHNFVVGRCQDVTALRRTQETLREREATFTEVADHMADVLWIRRMGPAGLQYVNPAYETIWGRSREALFASPMDWYEAIHPDDRDAVQNVFMAGLVSFHGARSYRVLRPNGDVRWIREHISEVPNAQGELRHLVGLAQDVTAAQQAEESRLGLALARAAQATAEAQVRARDEVLAIVSHDLRNPLTAVDAVAHRLGKPLPDDKRLKAVITLRTAIGRMTRLLDDLLDVSRMEAGQFAIHREKAAPQTLLDDTLAAFAESPHSDRGVLLAEVGANVPERIYVDHFRIVQALTNLVGNALKFTPLGGRVQVGISCDAGGCRFSVADTGAGIPSHHQAHLFDRFWQADRQDRRGAGLGLSIVKGIVEAHGGRVWCESEPHKGSRFIFVVPCEVPTP